MQRRIHSKLLVKEWTSGMLEMLVHDASPALDCSLDMHAVMLTVTERSVAQSFLARQSLPVSNSGAWVCDGFSPRLAHGVVRRQPLYSTDPEIHRRADVKWSRIA